MMHLKSETYPEDTHKRPGKAAIAAPIHNIIHSHHCEISRKTIFGNNEILNKFVDAGNRFTRPFKGLNTICISNPLTQKYFKSETAVNDEKVRQIELNCWYIVHPLSKLRICFEVWQLFLYSTMVIIKPMNGALPKAVTMRMPFFPELCTMLDLLSWLTILFTFFNGYIIDRTNSIILEPKRIAWHYVSSAYFTCDVLSSIPVFPVIHFWEILRGSRRVVFIGILYALCELKVVRIVSVINNISHLAIYLRIKARESIFLLMCMLVMTFTVHNCTILQLLVPKLVRIYFTKDVQANLTWYAKSGISEKPFSTIYTHCVFRSSAYILSIHLDLYTDNGEEDIVLALVTYIVGKIIICTTYVVLAVTLLSNRSMKVKFQSIICELNQYMKQKELPLDLQRRIRSYYNFKYQGKYFKEGMVHDMLSDKLKTEVNLHVCRSLLQNVSILADLTPDEVTAVVTLLTPEIFLPKDTIMQSGCYGACMYFISSGTVAVYTHSGREIWHLQDGDYFGEVSMVMKTPYWTVTVIAIETTQVYRLKRKDFIKYMLRNQKVLKKVQRVASKRFLVIKDYEMAYKKMLFEQAHRGQYAESDHEPD